MKKYTIPALVGITGIAAASIFSVVHATSSSTKLVKQLPGKYTFIPSPPGGGSTIGLTLHKDGTATLTCTTKSWDTFACGNGTKSGAQSGNYTGTWRTQPFENGAIQITFDFPQATVDNFSNYMPQGINNTYTAYVFDQPQISITGANQQMITVTKN